MPEDGIDGKNQLMSESDLNNILVEEELDLNKKTTKESTDLQYSDEDISTRELPSSQGAFRNLEDEVDNSEGYDDLSLNIKNY